jgi:hypothetical protein
MSNEEYQVLIRRTGAEARARCVEGASEGDRDEVARAIGGLDDSDVPMVLADLGGHDTVESLLGPRRGGRRPVSTVGDLCVHRQGLAVAICW